MKRFAIENRYSYEHAIHMIHVYGFHSVRFFGRREE
jgi:hypothetical protein